MKRYVFVLTVCFSLFVFRGFAQEEILPPTIPVEDAEFAFEDVPGEEVPAEGETSASEIPQEESSPQERYQTFRASSEKIRMLETDTDIFSASQTKKRVVTSVYNGELQRRFYDESFRVEKIEYWKIENSSAKSRLARIMDFDFFEDGKINSIKEKDFANNTESLSFFYTTGKIKSKRIDYIANEEIDSFEIFTYKYDGQERLLEERRQLYKVFGKKQRIVLNQLNINKYSGESLFENSFYENSVLRLRTAYDSKNQDTYIQTTYFDGGIVVRDFYQDGVKTSSSISRQGANEH